MRNNCRLFTDVDCAVTFTSWSPLESACLSLYLSTSLTIYHIFIHLPPDRHLVQFSSFAKLCSTLRDPMNLPTQGLNPHLLHLLIAGRLFTYLVLMSDILLLGTLRTVTAQVVSSGTGWHFVPKHAHNIGHKEKGHSTYSERSLLRSDF